jgi:thiamine-phosphate pyrophosphorylase
MYIPRFYPIVDTQTAARHTVRLRDAVEQLLDGGVEIVQFRHKGVFDRDVFLEIERIARLCRDAKVMLVINDRADLARIFGAGLHLGQDDLKPSQARSVTGPQTCIGYSTHSEAQLRSAACEPADYLAFGPIFGTTSKENPDPTVGLAELSRVRPLTDRPLVAIGGITRENARSVIEAGADSIAVIGDLFPDVHQRAAEFLRAVSH